MALIFRLIGRVHVYEITIAVLEPYFDRGA